MTLVTTEGRVAILALILEKISSSCAPERAQVAAADLVDIADFAPGDYGTSAGLKLAFESTPVAQPFRWDIDREFLRTVDPLLPIDPRLYSACLLDDPRLVAETQREDKGPIRRLFTHSTSAERLTIARRWLLEEKRLDERGQTVERRYEPGQGYGPLFFIKHPYRGFLDQQIWLTPSCDLLWIDEKQVLLDALAQGASRARGMIALTVLVTAIALASVASYATIPWLTQLPGAVYVWSLGNPIEAIPLFIAGTELTLSIATGQELPAISFGDEIALMAKGAVNAGKGLLTEVRLVIQDAPRTSLVRHLRVLVKDVRLSVRSQLAPRVLYYFAMAAKGAAVHPPVRVLNAGKTVPQLTAAALALLNGKVSNEVLQKIANSNNPIIINAANRFAHASGIGRVLSEAFSSVNKQQGAEFVLRFALSEITEADALVKPISFELRSLVAIGDAAKRAGAGGKGAIRDVVRYVDIFFNGVRYELKAVKRVSAALVRGKKGEFGELQRDIFKALGGSLKETIENIARLRWVFDGSRLVPRLSADKIAEKLYEMLTKEGTLFHAYPLNADLKKAIQGMVKVVY